MRHLGQHENIVTLEDLFSNKVRKHRGEGGGVTDTVLYCTIVLYYFNIKILTLLNKIKSEETVFAAMIKKNSGYGC